MLIYDGKFPLWKPFMCGYLSSMWLHLSICNDIIDYTNDSLKHIHLSAHDGSNTTPHYAYTGPINKTVSEWMEKALSILSSYICDTTTHRLSADGWSGITNTNDIGGNSRLTGIMLEFSYFHFYENYFFPKKFSHFNLPVSSPHSLSINHSCIYIVHMECII